MNRHADISFDVESIQNRMFVVANNLVGKMGKPTSDRMSVTGEEYVEFVYKTKDLSTILPKWKDWINGYCVFAKNCMKGRVEDTNAPLHIYWRVKPEIKKYESKFYVYARLLISTLTAKNAIDCMVI